MILLEVLLFLSDMAFAENNIKNPTEGISLTRLPASNWHWEFRVVPSM